jgi:malonyl-CoA/methylmalonyl-CoA synthetase
MFNRIIKVAQKYSDRAALRQGLSDLNYSYLLTGSRVVSSQLRRNAIRDQNVAFLCPPGLDYVAGNLAIWNNGNCMVPLYPMHPVTEWEYYLTDSGAKHVLVHDSLVSSLRPLAERLRIDLTVLKAAYKMDAKNFSLDDVHSQQSDSNALIIYTSGSTGRPKGVVHTHASLDAQCASITEAWEMSENDFVLNTLPLFHTHGLVNALYAPLSVGSRVEFMPFGAVSVCQWIKRRVPSNKIFMGVPKMYQAILTYVNQCIEEEQKRVRQSKVKVFISGSSPLSNNLFTRWNQTFGSPLLERYGMSETGMICTNPFNGKRVIGTVGQPFPGVEVKIVDETTGNEVKDGQEGELLVKSKSLFKEYLNRPEATAQAFDKDGWFKTGDIAVKEDHHGKVYYKLRGRSSVDILKINGFKVSATDIENELNCHPNIEKCTVFGINNKDGGDTAVALVVAKEGSTLTEESISEWLGSLVAKYKIPKKIHIVNEIPVNAMGKVNKKHLRKNYQQGE